MLATLGISIVLMIALGQYLLGLLFLGVFLGNYLQHRTIK